MTHRLFQTSASIVALLSAASPIAAKAQSTTGTTPDVDVVDTNPVIRDESADSDGTKSYTTPATTILGKQPLRRREVPSSVSVMTRQQMNDQNLNTLAEALNWVPGVVMVSNDESQWQFISRGGALESASDGGSTISGVSGYQQLDAAIYDRIEVLKGPAGLLMGTGSISGVMNMVKKRPQHEFALTARVSGGSWNNFLQEGDIGGPLDKNGRVRARAVFSHNSKNFFYDRSKEDRWVGYAVADIDLTSTTLVSASYTRQKYDGPSFSGNPAYATGEHIISLPRSTNVYPDWAFTKWDTEELHAEAEQHLFGDWVAKISYTARNQVFEFKDSYPTSGVTTTLLAPYARRHALWTYDRDVFDAYVQGTFSLLGQQQSIQFGYTDALWRSQGLRITVSPNLNNINILDPNSVPNFDLPYNTGSVSETRQNGFYGQLRLKPISPLTAVFGARASDYSSRSRNIAPSVETAWADGLGFKNQASYYGGLLFDITSNVTLYGSYADIFAAQTVKDYLGNTLPPRIGAQYEGGVKVELFDKRLNTSLAFFQTRERNRSFSDPDHPGFFLAIGKLRVRGIEAEVSGTVLPGWQVTGGYTLLDHEYEVASGGLQGLPISGWYPRHQLKFWNKYEFQQGSLAGLSLGGGLLWQSRTKAGTSGTNLLRQQAPYAVVDLFAEYRLSPNVAVSANINNLFDQTYYTRLGGTNTYNTFGRPRNFTISLKLNH